MEKLMKKYNLTTKLVSDRFKIPYRTVQNWKLGTRQCPEYVLLMMEEILSNCYKDDSVINRDNCVECKTKWLLQEVDE